MSIIKRGLKQGLVAVAIVTSILPITQVYRPIRAQQREVVTLGVPGGRDNAGSRGCSTIATAFGGNAVRHPGVVDIETSNPLFIISLGNEQSSLSLPEEELSFFNLSEDTPGRFTIELLSNESTLLYEEIITNSGGNDFVSVELPSNAEVALNIGETYLVTFRVYCDGYFPGRQPNFTSRTYVKRQ